MWKACRIRIVAWGRHLKDTGVPGEEEWARENSEPAFFKDTLFCVYRLHWLNHTGRSYVYCMDYCQHDGAIDVPTFFKDTLFCVDRLHWLNHTGCSYGHCMDSYQNHGAIDDTTAILYTYEQLQHLKRFRYSSAENVSLALIRPSTLVGVIPRSLAQLTLELIITLGLDLQAAVNWEEWVDAALSTDLQSHSESPGALQDVEMPSVGPAPDVTQEEDMGFGGLPAICRVGRCSHEL
ncbi:Hypp8217 [Branchiostoma lanceolatum]|uniref:Hypp8217 protein n=1 Tax=Branchiostoma lanceolatum TaxID=7740 RepID=A0A8J9Z6C3_BRALA|nr:Hypp8217 [Branchiostoma lanceolatum]